MSPNKGEDWTTHSHINAGLEEAVYETEQESINMHVISFQIGGYMWSSPLDINAMRKQLPKQNKFLIDIKHAMGYSINLVAEFSYV